MKKLITVILLFAVFQARGQAFEGTIRWTMRMEITDPAMKAQMEEAQKKMADPEMQAQMKEMEAQMNDPEVKKMMEANPQMKAQMEASMKMMKGGSMDPSSMMPKGMVIKLKGDNSVSKMEGGMTDGFEILHLKGQPGVRLDRKNKTYMKVVAPPDSPGGASVPKITKTSEQATIAGYKCTKYLVEMIENDEKITQYIWYTTDIKDFDFRKYAEQQRDPSGKHMFYSQIEGVPMKVEVAMPQGTMVMEVASVKRESIPQSELTIPADFKEGKVGPY